MASEKEKTFHNQAYKMLPEQNRKTTWKSSARFDRLELPALPRWITITGFEVQLVIVQSLRASSAFRVLHLLSAIEKLPRAIDSALGTIDQVEAFGVVYIDAALPNAQLALAV